MSKPVRFRVERAFSARGTELRGVYLRRMTRYVGSGQWQTTTSLPIRRGV